MVEITDIVPGSIAEELGLAAGDSLMAINGQPVRDLIDYQLQLTTENLLLEVLRADGERWDVEIEKDLEDDLGLELEHPEPTQCGNNCLFCFVHQLPPGMRSTLYVKDEDYRFSFLYGSYVTLTNVAEDDVRRIIDQKLSPIYVSVHATDEDIRQRLLGNEAPPILEILQRLAAGGIDIHAQIVLCPGINDGEEMIKTIEDLYDLHPRLKSLAVVPVGLTGYRERLPQLRVPSPEEARDILQTIYLQQEHFLRESGTRFVFAADEFYLKAGAPFPPLSEYEELSQLENGVGLIPLFRAEAEEALAEADVMTAPPVTLVTGRAPARELRDFAARLSMKTGVEIEVKAVDNAFFGGAVTVSGLLCGRDLISQLKGDISGDLLFIPDVMLKEGEELFLDDVSVEELEAELDTEVMVVDSNPWGLLYTLQVLQNTT
ncbi:MAG: DUF512 domain-containing protein [Desulfuromonadales bacterium]